MTEEEEMMRERVGRSDEMPPRCQEGYGRLTSPPSAINTNPPWLKALLLRGEGRSGPSAVEMERKRFWSQIGCGTRAGRQGHTAPAVRWDQRGREKVVRNVHARGGARAP
jgi:hypothetical protein